MVNEAAFDHSMENTAKEDVSKQYSTALKEATSLYAENEIK